MTVEEIGRDGHRIAARVPLPLDDDSELGVSRAMASALAGIAEALRDDRPDLLLILGDRYEALAGACAALLTRVPVAHLHGGELSEGAVDDAMRHAITKMAWLHFAATEASGRRIVQLGEEPSRVFVVGALGVDNALREATLTRAELEAELGPVFGTRTALVTFHPVTGEDHSSAGQIAELLAALDRCRGLHAVFTMPNADAGNAAIVAAIQDYCRVNPDRAQAFVSLGARRYLSLLACADVCIGQLIERHHRGTLAGDAHRGHRRSSGGSRACRLRAPLRARARGDRAGPPPCALHRHPATPGGLPQPLRGRPCGRTHRRRLAQPSAADPGFPEALPGHPSQTVDTSPEA